MQHLQAVSENGGWIVAWSKIDIPKVDGDLAIQHEELTGLSHSLRSHPLEPHPGFRQSEEVPRNVLGNAKRVDAVLDQDVVEFPASG